MAYNITAGRQGININDKHVDKNGYLIVPEEYELPVAGENTLGGVKVGRYGGLKITTAGELRVDESAYNAAFYSIRNVSLELATGGSTANGPYIYDADETAKMVLIKYGGICFSFYDGSAYYNNQSKTMFFAGLISGTLYRFVSHEVSQDGTSLVTNIWECNTNTRTITKIGSITQSITRANAKSEAVDETKTEETEKTEELKTEETEETKIEAPVEEVKAVKKTTARKTTKKTTK